MKAEYPYGEQESSVAAMSRPFDKTSNSIKGTNIHPHSELKNLQKNYHYLDSKNAEELNVPRDVVMYRTDFRSTLPAHPDSINQTHFKTIYHTSYNNQEKMDPFSRTEAEFARTRRSAGNFNANREESVRNLSNMVGELKKELGDAKEVTKIQRTWYKAGDAALSYSLGKTARDFKNKNIPVNDIQTNLNTNIGIHNIHPREIGDNYFRHIRQDATIQPNRSLCPRP
jgi:hypothetical protein